jgi:hypothetical protein
LPTRLVKATNSGAQLVSTEGWTSRPHYATLSHCWGRPDFLQLKTENELSFLQQIPVDDLPQTFKDALSIIRWLGLEYIWIDSLCIVQNSISDWHKEAAQMSSVYGGSHINIAASYAKSAHDGCAVKNGDWIAGLQTTVTTHGTDGGTKECLVQFQCREEYIATVWASHLSTRAWAFQEKILSPRTIHFSERGLYWECATTMAHDSVPGGFATHCQPTEGFGLVQSFRNLGDYHGW